MDYTRMTPSKPNQRILKMTTFHKNADVNQTIASMVADFCKCNKINKTKTESLVKEVLSIMPKAAGKPLSSQAKEIRQSIQDNATMLAQVFPEGFTIKELADHLQADTVTVSNQVSWLTINKSMFHIIGKRKQPNGGKGKPANVIAFK